MDFSSVYSINMFQLKVKSKNLPATKMVHSINVNSPSSDKKEILLKNINFAHNIKPIHFISRIFGLMPFRMVPNLNDGNTEPQVKILDIVWFIVAIFIYLFLAVFYFRLIKLPSDPNGSYVLVLGDKLLTCLVLVNAAIMVVKNMFDRFKLTEIVQKFISFDKKVIFGRDILYFRFVFYHH